MDTNEFETRNEATPAGTNHKKAVIALGVGLAMALDLYPNRKRQPRPEPADVLVVHYHLLGGVPKAEGPFVLVGK